MGYLSLSISFVVILLILLISNIVINKNKKNVKYLISIIYQKDHMVPDEVILSELNKMFKAGYIFFVIVFAIGLIVLQVNHSKATLIILHILLILPILINALLFRDRMNKLDKKYK